MRRTKDKQLIVETTPLFSQYRSEIPTLPPLSVNQSSNLVRLGLYCTKNYQRSALLMVHRFPRRFRPAIWERIDWWPKWHPATCPHSPSSPFAAQGYSSGTARSWIHQQQSWCFSLVLDAFVMNDSKFARKLEVSSISPDGSLSDKSQLPST